MRVEADVEAISTSGALHFLVSDPVRAQRYEDLIPSSGGGKDAPPPPSDAPSA